MPLPLFLDAMRTSMTPSRTQLNFMAAIVDDENVEQPKDVHADENRGFFDQLPVLEDAHVAVRNSRTLNRNRPKLHRWTWIGLGFLRRSGDINHIVGGTQGMPPHQCDTHGFIANGGLTTGVDDRANSYVADLRTRDQQIGRRALQG